MTIRSLAYSRLLVSDHVPGERMRRFVCRHNAEAF